MGESVMKHGYRNKQQGVVLVIALIALVAISLAGVALMRTVDTGNVISGNIAFNETATQMADLGAELAYAEINTNLYLQHDAVPNLISPYATNNTGCEFAANCPPYYSLKLLGTTGVLPWSAQISLPLPGETTATASYQVQYRIERMCKTNTVPATFADCTAILNYDGPKGADGTPTEGKLFYRVTVQTTGPRNTVAQSQYFYGVPDSL